MQLLTGEVKKVDYEAGTLKIYFPGIDDTVDDIGVICGFMGSTCLPNKGAQVLVLMEENQLGKGYAIGEFYSTDGMRPDDAGEENWSVNVGSPVIEGKNIHINADSVTINGKSVKTE